MENDVAHSWICLRRPSPVVDQLYRESIERARCSEIIITAKVDLAPFWFKELSLAGYFFPLISLMHISKTTRRLKVRKASNPFQWSSGFPLTYNKPHLFRTPLVDLKDDMSDLYLWFIMTSDRVGAQLLYNWNTHTFFPVLSRKYAIICTKSHTIGFFCFCFVSFAVETNNVISIAASPLTIAASPRRQKEPSGTQGTKYRQLDSQLFAGELDGLKRTSNNLYQSPWLYF